MAAGVNLTDVNTSQLKGQVLGSGVQGFSPAAGQKNGRSNQKRNFSNGHRLTQKNTDITKSSLIVDHYD